MSRTKGSQASHSKNSLPRNRDERLHVLKRRVSDKYGSNLLTGYAVRERVKDRCPSDDSAESEVIAYALAVLWAHFSRSVMSWHVDEDRARWRNNDTPHPVWREYLRGMLASERDPRIPSPIWDSLKATYGSCKLTGLVGGYWESKARR